MSSLRTQFSLVCFALVAGLSACSDTTQFTEKTLPNTLDAITSETAPAEQEESSLDPISGDAPTDETVVYNGGVEAGSYVGTVASETETTSEATASEASAPASSSAAPSVTQPAPEPSLPIPNNMIFKPCDTNLQKAIVAQVYALPTDTQKLPNFANFSPVGDDVCLSQLNITERAFSEGFPGVPELFEWFGLDLRFQVNVPSSGTYAFTIKSDDGSILFIDGAKVVDNDGLHQTKEASGSKFLSKGLHTFQVKYYQGPRYHIALELFWKTPGAASRSYIPEALLSRP